MRILQFIGLLLLVACTVACNKQIATPPTPPADSSLYFPPATGTWATTTPQAAGWKTTDLSALYTFLEQKNTKAFIVLHQGRIVAERYFGTFTVDSNWYWASAGKTVTALLTGMAQEDGHLRLSDASRQYLGTGWTSATPAQEAAITIRHQLTMTTGLQDAVADRDCTEPGCLTYLAPPGTRWAYHNAPYTLLDKVLENATGKSFNAYFQEKIRNPTGMNGLWLRNGAYNNVYFSTPRSMARFGLLLLAKGRWQSNVLLRDTAFLKDMTNPSQNLNVSYGYLTWLNGQSSHMLPIVRPVFPGALVPNAPPDMYAALGRDDQKLYVVPSKGIVIVRMGLPAGNVQLAVSSFDNELWGYLKAILP